MDDYKKNNNKETASDPKVAVLDAELCKILSQIEYLELFKNVDKQEVVKQILETRKFEIELYWKRSTYYWTLIGAIFVGFFASYSSLEDHQPNKLRTIFVLNCLGVLFSVGWYFVNRGSKYWQLNWEKHIDIIETSVVGPLYKTTISLDHYSSWKKFFNLTAPFPFSVSKINQILNISVIVFWLFLLGYLSGENLKFDFSWNGLCSFYSLLFYFTVIGFFSLFIFGQTGRDTVWSKRKEKTYVNFDKRAVDGGR